MTHHTYLLQGNSFHRLTAAELECFNNLCICPSLQKPNVIHLAGNALPGFSGRTISLPECPVCLSSYNTIANQPMSLSCGHSVCLECVSKLKNTCVVCKVDFTTSVPNYLWSTLGAASSCVGSEVWCGKCCLLSPNYLFELCEQQHIQHD